MRAADEPTITLEAFADTILPGEKRWPDDRAVAGAAPGPGAVHAGAIELFETPATGVTDGLEPLAQALSAYARSYAQDQNIGLDESVPPFVALAFDDRTALLRTLLAPGREDRDGWVMLAMFSTMAYDSAPHRHTAEAIAEGHPGLRAMGIAEPDADGLTRFPEFSYGRKLAELHPDTTASGSPA